MKFVNRKDFRNTTIDAYELVSTAVNDAGSDKHGALETLQAKVSELTIIVGMLVARLPYGDLVRFADEMAFSVVSREETAMNDMWEALEKYQPYADKHGFGAEWLKMTTERTKEAVWALRRPNSPLRAKDDAAYYAVCAVCASESKAAVVVGREAATVADAIRLINKAIKREETK